MDRMLSLLFQVVIPRKLKQVIGYWTEDSLLKTFQGERLAMLTENSKELGSSDWSLD